MKANVLPYDRIKDKLFLGDAAKVLKKFPNVSIDLIVTSPPYADNRRGTYKGFPISKYVDLFLPIAAELKRVLKPEGSFILNVKERAVNGERRTYILELILALKKQGWLWVEEYMWCKSNCYPGKWPNRFRDSWERCLHFTVQKKFKMRQERVMIPVGEWANGRLKNLSQTDKIRDNSKVGSGFGKNVSHWLNRDLVYPTNVLHLSTECANRKHSATFPIGLPSWFIKLFTDENDLVLDPFMGVATTALACLSLNRHYTGVELSPEYYKLAKSYIKAAQAKIEKRSDRRGNAHHRVREQDFRQFEGIPQTQATGSPKSTSVTTTKTQEPIPI